MKSTLLKFNNLTAIATFIKTIKPNGYTIHTLDLTLACKLNTFEIAHAIKQYGATPLHREAIEY